MMEQGYLCWHEGHARTAVDIWRHESLKELGSNKVTVYVKDIDENQKSFTISRSGDRNAPEAFH